MAVGAPAASSCRHDDLMHPGVAGVRTVRIGAGVVPHRTHRRCARIACRHDHHRILTPPCPLAQVVREPCARWLVDFHLHRALGAYERRGHLCTLCTLALRRCLRPDEFLVLRCADPRPLALPMCLHEHVLTICVPLSCRLSAGIIDGMSSGCSKLACGLSLELCGAKESPWRRIVR